MVFAGFSLSRPGFLKTDFFCGVCKKKNASQLELFVSRAPEIADGLRGDTFFAGYSVFVKRIVLFFRGAGERKKK